MPPPNDSSKVRVESSTEMRSEDRLKDDNTSSSAQTQMLFVALRSVIIPLIQAAVPNCPDLRDVPLEYEAKNFLAALQKHVSCIICDTSQSDNQNGITRMVDLKDLPSRKPPSVNLTNPEEVDKIDRSPTVYNEISPGTVPSHEQHPKERKPICDGSQVIVTMGSKGIEKVVYTIPSAIGISPEEGLFNMTLTRLRIHVFNVMPIRLLCFENRGSKLDITLLDRAAIYSRLIPKLKDAVKSYNSQFHTRGQWVFNFSSGSDPDSDPVTKIAAYAILSHTWLRSASGEVTYEDWHNLNGAFDLTHPGYQKLVNFCNVASEKHGLTLGWMDTVCINKASSAELDESIRSMYKWYQKAKVCITYLAETTTLSEMAQDAWFTRGWTLQELLAPECITFYNSNWGSIADYSRSSSRTDPATKDLRMQIKLATTITSEELDSPYSVSISRKMQWAAKREVTREEDATYSLMGMFDVNMSIAYGEGGRAAFIRLIKEILSNGKWGTIDIFNWGASKYDRPAVSALLPSSPKAYLQRSTLKFWRHRWIEPLTLTHLGLRIPVLLLRASSTPFPANTFTPIGDYYATITDIPFIESSFGYLLAPFGSRLVRSYNILDVKDSQATINEWGGGGSSKMIVFGILNCAGDEFDIHIPETCFAVAILHDDSESITTINPMVFGSSSQVPTEKPIVFSLQDRRFPSNSKLDHTIKKTQLARHGMRLLNMYL